MTGPVSLIICSRHRPRELRRALLAVAQMDHPCFEVVVVADPEGARAADGLASRIITFDAANLSAARNAGLAAAAAPVVAFLDDDAVPEPTWLSRLAAPFADPRVASAGGFVRGRSGLAWQWRAMTVDAAGRDRPLAVPPGVSLHAGTADRAVKVQGTCCAFRAAALRAAGGFDPALHFYLEDADASLRLAAAGGLTAVVPDAVVHHGHAASARRRADRVPRDLRQIGASLAVFLRRRGHPDAAVEIARQRAGERARALRHMVAGAIEPAEVGRLLAGFDAGVAEGLARELPALAPLPEPAGPLAPLPGTGPRPGRLVAGPARQRRQLEAEAAAARAAGAVVTLLVLSPGLRRHRLRFRDDGIWEQAGGRGGRGDRDLPPPWRASRAARIAAEAARLAAWRPVGTVAEMSDNAP
jgi:GT2 family glycosyltransferase